MVKNALVDLGRSKDGCRLREIIDCVVLSCLKSSGAKKTIDCVVPSCLTSWESNFSCLCFLEWSRMLWLTSVRTSGRAKVTIDCVVPSCLRRLVLDPVLLWLMLTPAVAKEAVG